MGYTWEGMTKISYEEAVKRWNNKEEVFLLYDDESEGLVEESMGDWTALEAIKHHYEAGGEFGYE